MVQPKATVVYGALLMIVAVLGATLVAISDLPTWLSIVLYVLAGVAALVGALWTLRDEEPPRRR